MIITFGFYWLPILLTLILVGVHLVLVGAPLSPRHKKTE